MRCPLLELKLRTSARQSPTFPSLFNLPPTSSPPPHRASLQLKLRTSTASRHPPPTTHRPPTHRRTAAPPHRRTEEAGYPLLEIGYWGSRKELKGSARASRAL